MWGATGAAAASTCSYALGAMLFLRWTARMGDASFPGSVVPRVADATAAWDGVAALIRSRQSTAHALKSRAMQPGLTS